MHIFMAWRNVWRNPKRTGIILIAIIIGAWSMLVFCALSRGIMVSTVESSLNTLTGHLQIQQKAYREDPVVENRITHPAPVTTLLNTILPPEAQWGFRIQVEGVASNAKDSKGIYIVGIDPKKEPELSFYKDAAITQGNLLKPNDRHGIVIGEALLRSLETKIGRKVVLMSQSANQETASMAFKIRGTFRTEMEATEKQYVFITLAAAQQLLGINNSVTSACIRLTKEATLNKNELQQTAQRIKNDLPKELRVLTWFELLPLLKGYLDLFDRFMLLWYVVIFTAMAFGLVNTMLMAVLERTKEFGLLKALGLRPVRIIRNVLLECLMLLMVGLVLGNLLAMLTIHGFSNGIDMSFMAQGSEFLKMGRIVIPFITAGDVMSVNAIILGLGILVCLYPAIKAGQITPIEAMTTT